MVLGLSKLLLGLREQPVHRNDAELCFANDGPLEDANIQDVCELGVISTWYFGKSRLASI